MAITVHIVPGLGRVLADVLTRDQVRALMEKAAVRVPRGVGPKDRPRGGREAARSVVPLVPLAAELLDDALTNYTGEHGEYIFSGTSGRKPLAGWTKAQSRMMKAMCAVSGERTVAPWTPHDLRRTVATRIAEQLGVGGERKVTSRGSRPMGVAAARRDAASIADEAA
jgi:hypothetical protein